MFKLTLSPKTLIFLGKYICYSLFDIGRLMLFFLYILHLSLTVKVKFNRQSCVLNYSSKFFYINPYIGYPQYMAQTLPPIKAVHGPSVTHIFIRTHTDISYSYNADYPIFKEKRDRSGLNAI